VNRINKAILVINEPKPKYLKIFIFSLVFFSHIFIKFKYGDGVCILYNLLNFL